MSDNKFLEYVVTVEDKSWIDPIFLPKYARYRFYKNSRRKNRIKTVQETIANYSRHLIKKKARKKAINKRNKKKHIGVK